MICDHRGPGRRSRDLAYAPSSDLLEELQFTLGEGTCVDAARTGRPVLVPDMADVTASGGWLVYAAAVGERAGVGAVFAMSLQWVTINLGVLDLHRKAAGSRPMAQLRDALGAADIAALMLLGLRTDPGEDRGLGAVVGQPAGDPPGNRHGGWSPN